MIFFFYPQRAALACVSYFDDFSNPATLSDYDYFDAGTQAAGTAASSGYQITGGELQDINSGGMAVVDSAYFSGTTDYQIDVDAEMDTTTGHGIFGIAFRTGSNGSFYSFQWNSDPTNAASGKPDWEIEKNTGTPDVSFSYLAGGTATGYTYGTWVHLTVAVTGNTFTCYVDNVQIYQVTDNSSPYTSGGVGMRSYWITSPNVARFKNFQVNTCIGTPVPTATPSGTAGGTATQTFTLTPTFTFTPTWTPTLTFTLTPTFTVTASSTVTATITQTTTITATFTFTPTETSTPCLTLHKNSPNPFSNGTYFIYDLCGPEQVRVKIFTISGEVVDELTQQGQAGRNSLYWNAENKSGKGVTNGTFIYYIEAGEGKDKKKQWGKMAVVK